MGYTEGMKTALSLPDDLQKAAERRPKRSGKSRSQLHAGALGHYLVHQSPDEITEAMNRVVDELGEQNQGFTRAAARHTLERVEW
jgi:metal-responsive CopG/Arc/MetJ family transcriptional regulator